MLNGLLGRKSRRNDLIENDDSLAQLKQLGVREDFRSAREVISRPRAPEQSPSTPA